jgi:hypothetical protein
VDKDDQKKDSAYRPGNARLLRRVAVVAALAATGLLATACGGGGSQSSGQNLAAELDSFASCVRSHGIPGFYFTTSVPSAPPDGGVIGDHQYYAAYDSTPAFEAAQKACQRLDPMGTPSGVTHQQFLKALRSAECMRSHGYPAWPDPKLTEHGLRVPVGFDTSSPQFQAAAKTCGLPPGA